MIVIGAEVPPATAGPDRQVRASFLRWLLTAGPDAPPLHTKGLNIEGALIIGDGKGAETPGLDLEGCTLAVDLALFDCRLPDLLLLRSARLRNLFLNGSHLTGIKADGLQTEGDLFLRRAVVEGEVRLLGARLGGDLDCVGATLRQANGSALNADRLQAEGSAFLRRARVEGEVLLLGARLGGDLSCIGAALRQANGNALNADGLQTEGGVFLRETEVEGTLSLLGARLGGELDCVGATLRQANGNALNADRLQTEGSVFLRETEVEGTVRLLGARLSGGLDCTSATLRQANGNALNADRLQSEGGVFLRETEVEGTVRLLGARLGGDLSCSSATLRRPEGSALNASTAEVAGALFWIGGTTVEGAVNLRAASFRAIYDDRACWPKPGELLLDRCSYDAFLGTGVPISAEARIEWLGRQYAEGDGQEFRPQPWEQCAKVLREMGHVEDARDVLIDKERRLRADRLRPERTPSLVRRAMLRSVDLLLDYTVRFGHRPMLAARWAVVFWALGAAGFMVADRLDGMVPNNAFILRSPEWVRCLVPEGADLPLATVTAIAAGGITVKGLRRGDERVVDCFHRQPEADTYPRFEPISYALDTLLPIVELHQQEYWTPNRNTWAGWAARGYLWLHIIAGWGLSLLAVAGFSGLVKSD